MQERASKTVHGAGAASPAVARAHAIGAWTLVTLGVGHGLGTLFDCVAPTFFSPIDPAVLADMQATPVAIGAWLGGERMTVWRGHLGWNLSVSLGFAFTGALQLLLRRLDADLRVPPALLRLAVVASAAWALIGGLCWFWVPSAGFLLAAIALGYALAKAPRAAVEPGNAHRRTHRLLWMGGLPIGVAGFLHLLATFPDLFTEGAFSPVTASVRRSMEQTSLALPAMFGRPTSTWEAYAGFHLAHGVAATVFGVSAFLAAGVLRPSPSARPVLALFAAASLAWAAIAATCWFWAPLIMTSLGAAAHVAAVVLARPEPPPR